MQGIVGLKRVANALVFLGLALGLSTGCSSPDIPVRYECMNGPFYTRYNIKYEQDGAYKRAEEALLADYAVIPLYFYVSKHLVSPAVRGFVSNPLDVHPSRYLSLK